MSSINASRRLWSITSKHRSAEVHLLIQRPGFRPTEIILVTTLVTPNAIPKLNSPTSINCAGNGSEASQNDFEDGDDFATPEMVQKEI